MRQKSIFFLGIGGIGMSALARYMHHCGYLVAGYDRTRSIVTDGLSNVGIDVIFADSEQDIPIDRRDKETTLVVYTPAIPHDHPQLRYFERNGFKLLKRAELLGMLTSPENGKKALCVAGTHGKTTTSTILAHLLYSSAIGCDAFLGGISNNYNSNLLIQPNLKTCPVENGFAVAEADEYDRSFLKLQPYMAVITNCEADHLDIYGTEQAYKEAFAQFAEKITPNGILLRHTSVKLREIRNDIQQFTYCIYNETEHIADKADFYADNIRIKDSRIYFDFHFRQFQPTSNKEKERSQTSSNLLKLPQTIWNDLCLGVPVMVAVEDCVAAVAVAHLCGVTKEEIYNALESYNGVYRRFNVLYNKKGVVYIDDYAHHPTELSATIRSAKMLYPEKRIVGIFQPHLYTRTRDFADDFAKALSELDEVILIPIYPAREEPIKGIDSQFLMCKVARLNPKVCVMEKEQLADYVRGFKEGVLLTLGAGNIENMREIITNQLSANE